MQSEESIPERKCQKQKKDVCQPKLSQNLIEGEPGTLTGRPLRLYADGIFDLFHLGHARALKQVKEAYPNVYVMVGCCNDKITHKLKGKTVLKDYERYESLTHCKWVDEVIKDAPWVINDQFMEEHQIDYVCHDAIPYSDTSGSQVDDIYAKLKKKGKFYETSRTDGISTSELIVRIVSEYDTFIRRNLQRGYTAKEMNVPWIKEKQVQIDEALNDAKSAFNDSVLKARKKLLEVSDVFSVWGEKADILQHQFLEIFDKHSDLRCQIREKRYEIFTVASNTLNTTKQIASINSDSEAECCSDTSDEFISLFM